MNIGKQLKAARKEAGLTQGEAAKKLRITQAELSYYESGKRDPSGLMIQKHADLYNVPLPFLLWQAMEAKDVKPGLRSAFKDLHASVNGLIKEVMINS